MREMNMVRVSILASGLHRPPALGQIPAFALLNVMRHEAKLMAVQYRPLYHRFTWLV